MKVIRDIESKYKHLFKESTLALNNAFMILDDEEILTYEFEIIGFKAIIHANTYKYLEEVVEEFRFFNGVISEYEYDGRIIKSYLPTNIIRLPISILQPSQFYISEQKLDNINSYLDEEDIYIPVALIDDEYVILDGHTRIYSMLQNYSRMVNCYLDEYDPSIKDFVYLAKEQNITTVKNMKVLSAEQYKVLWHDFCDMFFKMRENI